MSGASDRQQARMFIATIVVILVVLGVWKLIDYRTQPPPPPNPIGVTTTR